MVTVAHPKQSEMTWMISRSIYSGDDSDLCPFLLLTSRDVLPPPKTLPKSITSRLHLLCFHEAMWTRKISYIQTDHQRFNTNICYCRRTSRVTLTQLLELILSKVKVRCSIYLYKSDQMPPSGFKKPLHVIFHIQHISLTLLSGHHRYSHALLGCFWRTRRLRRSPGSLQTSPSHHPRSTLRRHPHPWKPEQPAANLPGEEREPLPGGGKERSLSGRRGSRRTLGWTPVPHGEGHQCGESGDGDHRDCF